jgi:uncharacterized protein YbjT (DUF2867 family)
VKVLVLGADGFIGRHIAFYLRAQGVGVLAHARNPARLAAMGFETLRVDLCDPACHRPAFWAGRLAGVSHVINAAGLLTGAAAEFEAVHLSAPAAVYAALPQGHGLLISAVGIEAETEFAIWRRRGEAAALAAGATVLRAGLVLGDSSYGGSSLIRALAALPFVTPVVGDGAQAFNPIHASDLAAVALDCLRAPPAPQVWEIGGPERVTQREVLQATRAWLGLPEVPVLALPLRLARALGRAGDLLKLGPISATSVAQLQRGVLAAPEALLAQVPSRPRGFRSFLNAQPAGTQDLWQARLYLLKPLIRLTLAVMWLVSAGLGLLLPAAEFLPAVKSLA